jgi:hypothetical protein
MGRRFQALADGAVLLKQTRTAVRIDQEMQAPARAMIAAFVCD